MKLMTVFLLLLASPFCWAIQTYEVSSRHSLFQFLIIAKDHETPAEALDAFKKTIFQDPDLMSVYTSEQLADFQIKKAE